MQSISLHRPLCMTLTVADHVMGRYPAPWGFSFQTLGPTLTPGGMAC